MAAGVHQPPELDITLAIPKDVVEIRQTEVVPVLVGKHPNPGVLGLHDVVEHPDVVIWVATCGPCRARDVSTRGGHDIRAVRPNCVSALRTATTLFADAGVDDHQVIHHAVVVDIELIPVETRLPVVEDIYRVDDGLLDTDRVVGVAHHAGPAACAAVRPVPGLRVGQLEPVHNRTRQVVEAVRVLQEVGAEGVARDVDPWPSVRTCEVGPHSLGDTFLGEHQGLVVTDIELGHPECVVVPASAHRCRIGKLIVKRAREGNSLHHAGGIKDIGRPLPADEGVFGLIVEFDQQRQQLRLLWGAFLGRGIHVLLEGPSLSPGQCPRRSRVGS